MFIDVLVAEIGSTTTIVNAFDINSNNPRFIGRGVSNTTVDTDVNIGLKLAINDLSLQLNSDEITYGEMFASSSAAGGLRMTVHGLVYEMTVRASKEAALNAGANIHLVTANRVTKENLKKIKEINPNIILIAGGTDFGEKETAIYNTQKIIELNLEIPIIYAGNIENHEIIRKMFKNAKMSDFLKIVENVYPRVDLLNILPLRKVIYETFEENIVKAKGMERILKIVNQKIMPTPGSVMEATMILFEKMGNLMTIDVGGATTDIHSIANPSEEYQLFQEGEPLSKRSVEGDLGVFINHKNVLNLFEKRSIFKKIGIDIDKIDEFLLNYTYIPSNIFQNKFVYELTKKCTHTALDRHVGDIRKIYTSSGQKIIPEGKDLSQIRHIVLTGGALINLENTEEIISDYIMRHPSKLLPRDTVNIITDNDYIMASVGVLSLKYPEIAYKLLQKSFRIE